MTDFVASRFNVEGINLDDMIRNKMKSLDGIASYDKLSTEEAKWQYAREEVIADSMETMFKSGNVMRDLADLKTQSEGLFNKIRGFLKKFADKIRTLYEKINPETAEGKFIAESKDSVEQLEKLFANALKVSAKNYAASEKVESTATPSDSAVMSGRKRIDNSSFSDYTVYTETDDFIRNVSRRDRSAFARSLANKTTGMSDGETRVLNIYCAEKIYCFSADGYMHGEMMRSYDVDEYAAIKDKEKLYEEIYKDTASSDVWTTTASREQKGQRSDLLLLGEQRRGSDSNDSLSDDASGSNGTGSAERIRGYNPSSEELAELLRRLKEKLNLEDTDPNGGNSVQSTRLRDTEYLDAVNRGDMETAQRMVDEAAKAAGYTVKAYHGTDADFTVFDKNKSKYNTGKAIYGTGLYFSTSTHDAKNYGKNIISVYLRVGKVLDLDGGTWTYDLGIEEKKSKVEIAKTKIEKLPKGFINLHYTTKDSPNVWQSISNVSPMQLTGDETGKQFAEKKLNPQSSILPRDIKNLSELARNNGYTSIKGAGTNIGDIGTEYVLFDTENIKSADPVTYDDDGNVIPLSERFNERNPDIRYSRRSTTDSDGNDLSTEESELSRLRDEYAKIRKLERDSKKALDAIEAYPDLDELTSVISDDNATEEKKNEMMENYARWRSESGYTEAYEKHKSFEGQVRELSRDINRMEERLSKSLREKKYSEDEIKATVQKAVRKYHTTPYLSRASYLLTTGSMLDFSDGQGYRVKDHREISEILDLPDYAQYADGMIIFMNMGNIRLQTYGIEISSMPNSRQISSLRDIIFKVMKEYDEFTVDFSKPNGNSDGSVTYPKGVSSSKIISDIKNYFETGIVPEYENSLSYFRYSLRNTPEISDRELLADALESVAENEIDRKKLRQYKAKIAQANELDRTLAKLQAKKKALTEAKAKRSEIIKVQDEITKTQNRITIIDKGLLDLESTVSLKRVLAAEKKRVRNEARRKQKDSDDKKKAQKAKEKKQEQLAALREDRDEKLAALRAKPRESEKKRIERHTRTETKESLFKVVNELNKLITRPMKEDFKSKITQKNLPMNGRFFALSISLREQELLPS